jgi:hypothetical protein
MTICYGMLSNSRPSLRWFVGCLATSSTCLVQAAPCDDEAVLARNRSRREQAIERAWGDRAAARGWSANKAREVLVSVFFGKEYKAFDAQQLPLRRALAELRDFGNPAAASPPTDGDYCVAVDELAHRLGEMEEEQMRWAVRTLEAAE